jgi:hypothetical protein
MSSAPVPLTTPFTINGVQYNDGDYITLQSASPPVPYNQLPNNVQDTMSNYTRPDQSTMGPFYIGAGGNYSFNPQLAGAKIRYDQHSLSNGNKNLNTYWIQYVWDPTTGEWSPSAEGNNTPPNVPPSTQTEFQYDKGETIFVSDAHAGQAQALHMRRSITAWQQPGPSDNLDTPQTKWDRQDIVDNTSAQYNTALILELHADNYIALRNQQGLYFHMMQRVNVMSSTYSGAANDYIVTFSNAPSQLATAQWRVFTTASGGICLQNRASSTFLSVDSAATFVQRYFELFAVGNQNAISHTSGSIFYTNNYVDQIIYFQEFYGQNIFRVLGTGTTSPSDALAEQNKNFIISKVTGLGCQISNNPTNSACINSADPAVKDAILSFCSAGDLAVTPACRSWLINNPSLATTAVSNYCSANPNDSVMCACTTLWPYRGIIDYIATGNAQSVGFETLCNVKECSTNRTTAWHPANETSCQIQVCVQGLEIDSVVKSQVTVNQTCNFPSSGSGSTPTPVPTPGTTLSTAEQLLELVMELFTSTITLYVFIGALVGCFAIALAFTRVGKRKPLNATSPIIYSLLVVIIYGGYVVGKGLLAS